MRDMAIHDWLEKLKKELGRTDLEQLFTHVGKKVRYNPFITDYPATNTHTDLAKFRRRWHVGQWFENSAPSQLNINILRSLSQGVDTVRLHFNASAPWATIFKNVHLEMISLDLYFGQEETLQSFKSFLGTRFDPGRHVISRVKSKSVAISEYGGSTLTFTVPNNPDMTSSLISLFSSIVKLGFRGEPPALRLECDIDQNIIRTLALIRSARKIWKSLVEREGRSPSPLFIIGVIREDREISQPEVCLIDYSSKLSQAIMAGADLVYIDKYTSQSDPGFIRLCQNLHHIALHEAHFADVDDPFAGSYTIEAMTDEMASVVLECI